MASETRCLKSACRRRARAPFVSFGRLCVLDALDTLSFIFFTSQTACKMKPLFRSSKRSSTRMSRGSSTWFSHRFMISRCSSSLSLAPDRDFRPLSDSAADLLARVALPSSLSFRLDERLSPRCKCIAWLLESVVAERDLPSVEDSSIFGKAEKWSS